MIRKLKRALGIHFSTKALASNPGIALRQYLGRFRSFTDLADQLCRQQTVTVVQVGANDGSANDPLRQMFVAHPQQITRALLVEPQTSAFGRLSARYADAANVCCLNAAINRQPGTQTVFSIDRAAVEAALGRPLSDGIASFERSHVERVLRAASPGLDDTALDRLIIAEEVRVTTLADATAEAGITQPDILLVDTEGFDAEILRMALEAGWHPQLLQFEHKHLSRDDRRDLSQQLRQLGYRLWTDHADIWGQRVG